MRRTLGVFLAVAVVVSSLPLAAQQQAGAPASSGKLELTSSSDVAKNEFRLLIDEFVNLRNRQAREHALKALEADLNFGLARVYLATAGLSPQSSADQRMAEMNKGLAATSTASAAEAMLALAVRENAAGRAPASVTITKALAQLVPNDAYIAFTVFQNERAGKTPEQLVAETRVLLAKFPDWAVGYNQYAYDQHAAGDHEGEVAALRQYVRLAPTQPNAHDTWADLMIQHDRLTDAVGHTQAALRLDSTWTQGYSKIGAIRLHEGNVAEARAQFTRAGEVGTTTASKLDAHYWMAVSYIYDHDAKSGIRELAAIIGEAVTLNGSAAQRALPHQRLAVVEAMLGDKKNVAPHLGHAAAIPGVNALAQAFFVTIAQGAAGDAAASQAGADAYAVAQGANAGTGHMLKAWAAVAAKNYAVAETELAQTASTDVLAKVLRAELLKQQGKTAEARAIKDEILKMVVKLNTNAGVDFNKLVARLRAEKI